MGRSYPGKGRGPKARVTRQVEGSVQAVMISGALSPRQRLLGVVSEEDRPVHVGTLGHLKKWDFILSLGDTES